MAEATEAKRREALRLEKIRYAQDLKQQMAANEQRRLDSLTHMPAHEMAMNNKVLQQFQQQYKYV